MFADLAIQMAPLWPGWLVGLVACALLAALGHGTFTMLKKHVPPRRVALLTGLRLAALLVFVLIALQPALSRTVTQPPLPVLGVLVDTSQSMEGRLDEALAALRQGDFARTLEDRFRTRWYHFADSVHPTTRDDVSRLEAKGKATHIADSLTTLAALLRAEGIAVPRVLLVSDGLDQGTTDTAETARRLGVTVDVLPARIGKSAARPAYEIADVQGARRVLLGSETHFRVTLRRASPAPAEEKLTLRMAEEGVKLHDLPIVFAKGQHERLLTLSHRPATAGTKQYTFQLAEGNAPPVQFLSQVLDGKFEILVLEDTWRWEYKFLHRLFEDDPSFRFTALLNRTGGSFTQFGSPDRRVSLVGFPQSRSELESFDLFFLGDVNPTRWPPRLAAGLANVVEEGGKSLVVIAGPNVAQMAEVPELHALLPVELVPATGKPLAGPIPVRLRADSNASPLFFQVSPDDVDALPPLDQIYPPLRKRPGATVLVESAKHRNPYGPLIVVAEHTVGRGRVLFIGTDALWKWHTLAPAKDGPTPYNLFWQQAMRALTPERSRLGGIDVWLRASRSRAVPGQKVELQAEIASDRPVTQVRVQAETTLPDGQRLPLSFVPEPARPHVLRAELAPPRPGVYGITAAALVEGQRAAEGSIVLHVEDTASETSDGSVDLAQLERLATATGGKLIDPARPDTWPAPAEAGVAVSQTRTYALWDNFTLLFLLCALLGADWFVRLRHGLV